MYGSVMGGGQSLELSAVHKIMFAMAQEFWIYFSRVDLIPDVKNNSKIQVCHERPPAV